MSTPERQQDADPDKGSGYGANDPPDSKGAEELEKRRQSEQDGQKRTGRETSHASESSEPHDDAPSAGAESTRSNAEQAKENERQAEVDGRELPG